MRGRSRLESGQLESAIEDFEISRAALPSTLTLKALANTYWMMQGKTAAAMLLIETMRQTEPTAS